MAGIRRWMYRPAGNIRWGFRVGGLSVVLFKDTLWYWRRTGWSLYLHCGHWEFSWD